jgi:hypothetical protein
MKILHRKKILWISLFLGIIFIKLFSLNHQRVETFYASSFYSFFSKILRFLFGWMPFSLGDVFYTVIACWLLWKIMKNVGLLFQKKLNKKLILKKCLHLILLLLFTYIVFNIFWGLNYNRKGVGWQLKLPAIMYDTINLKLMQELLLQKVNETKQILINEKIVYPDNKHLFERAKKCYDETTNRYSFIEYKGSSVKSSLYGWLGNYLGFTGYYNPFSGEAQVNTTVPKFLQPYITVHEMAHQLGYAKEDEANFVGYLVAANSNDTLFHYSAYLDLFLYANREVYYFDSTESKIAFKQLVPEVKADLIEWKRFDLAHTSFIEPAISWLYGKYLQVNQQPKGLRSYNEVIAMMIAYYKKFGKI